MAKRKLDEKKLRELQIAHGKKGGPGGRFGGLKEKPKNLKETINKVLRYISYSKKLLISLIVIAFVSTLFSLSTNIFVEKIIASLGKFDFKTLTWEVLPDKNAFITSGTSTPMNLINEVKRYLEDSK